MIELPAASRLVSGPTTDVRRRFLVTCIATTLLWGGLIAIPSELGWTPLGPVQSWNNLAFLAGNVALLLVLIRYPRTVSLVGAAFLTAAFAYATAAQFLVPEDALRMLLYFPLVGAAFLILGSAAGWIMALGALGAVGLAFGNGHFAVTPFAISTFVLTLGMTAVFFHVFRVQTATAMTTILAQNAALESVANQDHLTGLMNRRAFQDKLQSFLARQGAIAPFSIAFIDVDRFKEINDRFGHAAGDAVLIGIADVLRSAIGRRQDIVARFGGEEFALMLPHTDLVSALAISDELRSAIGSARIAAVPDLGGVTVSIGVASSASGFRSTDDMLRAADVAMYTAKREGRDRVVAWTP